MDVGIPVEKQDWRTLLQQGIVAGLVAGIALGLAQFMIAAAREEPALTPLRVVASLLLGQSALESSTSTALVIILGTVLHILLSIVFGVVFVAILALTFQLSARRWLLIGYGFLFGFILWEVNFLAILPVVYPALISRVELTGQIWEGIVSYSLVYGPALALYMSFARPGVLTDWRS